MTSSAPSIAVVGAGATGSLLAACMAEAGIGVTLIARDTSLDVIKQEGIRVIRPNGRSFVARPSRITAPGAPVSPADISIFLVQSYDTANAARSLAPLVRGGGYVLSLQNGADNERILSHHVGEQRVIPGMLYAGVERLMPGVVSCTVEPRIVFGRGNAGGNPPIDRLADSLRTAGVDVSIEDNVIAAKWEKFFIGCGLNPLMAITGRLLNSVLSSDDGLKLYTNLVDEAIGVATADGAPIGPDTRDQVIAAGRMLNFPSATDEQHSATRHLELETFFDYVRRAGAKHEIPTPVTDTFYRLLKVANTLKTR